MGDKVIETDIVNCRMDDEGAPSHVNDYKIIKLLGEGSFGKVYQCHNSKGKEYALKILNKSILKRKKEYKKVDGKMVFANAFQKVQREVAIMKKLCHKHLVQLHEIIDSPEDDKLFLVLELVHGGQIMHWDEKSFRYWTRKYPSGVIPNDVVKNCVVDVIMALDYLHANHICHRDIKPENILIAETEEFKLADFGVAQMLEGSENQRLRSTEGTYHFLAPECTTGLEYDPYRVDIWALGVTMYVMLQGTLPFGLGACSLTQVIESIQKDDFKCSPEIEQECIQLLKRLLDKDPMNRITIEELKHHPWLEMKKRTQRASMKIKIIEVTQQEIDAAFTPVNNFILMAKLKMKMNSRLSKARKSIGARNSIVINPKDLNGNVGDASAIGTDSESDVVQSRPVIKKKNSKASDESSSNFQSACKEPTELAASTSEGSTPVFIKRDSRSEVVETPVDNPSSLVIRSSETQIETSGSEQSPTASSIPVLVKKQSSKKLLTEKEHPVLIKKTSKSQVIVAAASEDTIAPQTVPHLIRKSSKPKHSSEDLHCDNKPPLLVKKTSKSELASDGISSEQTAPVLAKRHSNSQVAVEVESSERTNPVQEIETFNTHLDLADGNETAVTSDYKSAADPVALEEPSHSASRSISDSIVDTGKGESPANAGSLAESDSVPSNTVLAPDDNVVVVSVQGEMEIKEKHKHKHKKSPKGTYSKSIKPSSYPPSIDAAKLGISGIDQSPILAMRAESIEVTQLPSLKGASVKNKKLHPSKSLNKDESTNDSTNVDSETIKGASLQEPNESTEEKEDSAAQDKSSASDTPLVCTTVQQEEGPSQSENVSQSVEVPCPPMTSKTPINVENSKTSPNTDTPGTEVPVVQINFGGRKKSKIERTVSLGLFDTIGKSPALPRRQSSIKAALDALGFQNPNSNGSINHDGGVNHEPTENPFPLVKQSSGNQLDTNGSEGITFLGFPLANSRKKSSSIAPILGDEHATDVDAHGIPPLDTEITSRPKKERISLRGTMMNLLRRKSSNSDPNEAKINDAVIPFDKKYVPSGSIESQDRHSKYELSDSEADDLKEQQVDRAAQNIVLKSAVVQGNPSKRRFKARCIIM